MLILSTLHAKASIVVKGIDGSSDTLPNPMLVP